jgi:hypothetical protein
LGPGVYFWGQNPTRALEYAIENAEKKQFNKVPCKTPFVIGAIIELGNCLNLVEAESLQILSTAYDGLKKVMNEADKKMPINKGDNRALDCAVIKYIHQANKLDGKAAYDTITKTFGRMPTP